VWLWFCRLQFLELNWLWDGQTARGVFLVVEVGDVGGLWGLVMIIRVAEYMLPNCLHHVVCDKPKVTRIMGYLCYIAKNESIANKSPSNEHIGAQYLSIVRLPLPQEFPLPTDKMPLTPPSIFLLCFPSFLASASTSQSPKKLPASSIAAFKSQLPFA